jgi:hypothetical protein
MVLRSAPVPKWLATVFVLEMAMLLLLGVLFAMHAGKPPEAVPSLRGLAIVDEGGVILARISCDSTGVSLDLLDRAGAARASFSVIDGVPSLSLLDARGTSRLEAVIEAGDYAQVVVSDRNGNARIQLAESDSVAAVSLFNDRGIRQFYAGLTDSSSSGVSIADPDGNQNAALGWYGPGFSGPVFVLSDWPESSASLQAGCLEPSGDKANQTGYDVNSIRLIDSNNGLVGAEVGSRRLQP